MREEELERQFEGIFAVFEFPEVIIDWIREALRQSQQEEENACLRTHKQELDFVHDMCQSVDVRLEPTDFCVQWARQWQRFFQTSKVCLFLMPGPGDHLVETIAISNLMECQDCHCFHRAFKGRDRW